MKSILLVQALYDEPTSIQYKFFNQILEDIVRVSKAKGYNVILLKGLEVNEDTFKDVIERYDPRFVYLGSHGSGSRIFVRNENLILAGVNDNLLANRIVYAFTCRTFNTLAKTSNAEAFIGYSSDFVFSPEEPYVKIFMYLGFIPLRKIIEGAYVKDAYEYTRTMYRQYMRTIYNMGRLDIYELLEHNYRHFRFFGNPYARL